MSEQKPVAWMGQNPRNGSIELCQFKPAPSVLRDFNMKPLYANPTPDVVKQLVEALEQLMSIVTIHSRATANNFAWAEMDEAKAALAAAKEAGL